MLQKVWIRFRCFTLNHIYPKISKIFTLFEKLWKLFLTSYAPAFKEWDKKCTVICHGQAYWPPGQHFWESKQLFYNQEWLKINYQKRIWKHFEVYIAIYDLTMKTPSGSWTPTRRSKLGYQKRLTHYFSFCIF